MKEKNLKKQNNAYQQPKTKHQTPPKGITLVALVITVIILLILAGVALSMITGEDGLFGRANNAATKYNQAAQNEADWLNEFLEDNWGYFPEGLTNGSYNSDKGHNVPNTSELEKANTYYVTWKKIGPTYEASYTPAPTSDWFDYDNGKWANIKTVSEDESLEAYWVWIPRFAYKMPVTTGNGNEKQIDVVFLKDDTNIAIIDGEEVECFKSTDEKISPDGTGLYETATDRAKGISAEEQYYIVHPAFTFGEQELKGFWFAKFEASSSTPTASYGGGNDKTLKVQVKPGVTSWRYIQAANSWEVCREIQETGGTLGTNISRTDETATIDTHLAKNMEWAAVSVLSQSKYGVFNPQSATGLTENGGDGTLKVWNNANSSYITGTVTVADTPDATYIADINCDRYNTGNGPKGSSTGTVYGVYDMAGSAWEQVMGVMETSTGSNTPSNASTGFTNTTWPEAKYYDIYAYGTSYTDYSRGKIGDLTRELNPAAQVTWQGDVASFLCIPGAHYGSFFYRSGDYQGGGAGMFSYGPDPGGPRDYHSFRPVLVIM